MDKDIDDLIKVLKLKGYSNKTAKVYISNIKKYLLSNYEIFNISAVINT